MSSTKQIAMKQQGKRRPVRAANVPVAQRSFWGYYTGAILRPRRTFDALMADDRRLKFGLLAVLIPAIGYTLFYFMATAAGGAPSTFKPWLAIPIEQYFAYDRFIVGPSMLICWILAAGVAQLISKLFSGQGSFEDTLSALGFGISIAMWTTMIHELADGFLGFIGAISMQEYEQMLNTPTFWRGLYWFLMAAYLALFLLFFSKGVGAAQRIRRGPAVFTGVVAFIVFQVIFLVFNR